MPPVAAPEVIRPAFLWVPPIAVGTLGDEAAELAEQLDQDVREEERIALRALMPIKANGMPAGLEAGIVTGRQQVKTWAMRQALIHDGWVTKVGRCMWSAHRTKTSDDTFEELVSLVNSFDWLRKRVRRVYSGNGNHRIVFNDKLTTYPTMGASGQQKTDRTIEFGARENGPTGRGRTKINRLTLDEWLMGTKAMKGAQVPMMGAAGDRYIRHGSSPGLLTSADLRALRQRGRMGVLDPSRGDPSLSWVEWTSERVRLVVDKTGGTRMERVLPTCADPDCSHIAGLVTGCFLDDPAIIRDSCPAYGTARLSVEFVAQERLTLDPVEYARERAGIWEDPPDEDEAEDLFPGWDDCQVPGSGVPAAGTAALGIDTAWDSSVTWIGAATRLAEGRVRVELVASAAGTGWVREWLFGGDEPRVERLAPVAIGMQASSAPVSHLHDELAINSPALWRKSVKGLSGADLAKGGAQLRELLKSGLLEVVAHPRLNTAVTGATKRPMGDSWVVDRKGSPVDVSPLLSVIAAVRALMSDEPEDDYNPLDNIW